MSHGHLLGTAAHALKFMLAGNATVTFVSKATGARFTYKVQRPKHLGGVVTHFVKFMNGPNNEGDFAYLGFVKNGGWVHGGHKAKAGKDAPAAKAFAWAFENLAAQRLPENLEVWHSGTCGRCGRKLTVPSSIESGIGPECAGKV